MRLDSGTAAITRIVLLFALTFGGYLSDKESETGIVNDTSTANNPPTISGRPQAAVVMADAYSFTPSASGPDGNKLTFSVRNLPVWAAFDAGTGALTGFPALGDVGLFDQIGISASDGTDTASLSDFSIEVSLAALGSMTLSWTPPQKIPMAQP